MWSRKEFILMLSLFALLGVFGLSAGLGASAFDYQELNHQANLVVDSQKLQPKFAVYSDTNETIEFTLDEVNYVFSNLAIGINTYDFENLQNSNITYDGDYYYVDDFVRDESVSFTGNNGTIMFDIETSSVNFGRFLLLDIEGTRLPFEYGFILTLTDIYNDLVSSIQADIQANTAFDGGAVATDIVTTLVGGITGIATGLGAGVSALVSDIFINNGTLSVFGYIVVIFAGIALAIGLSRWVMNFLTSLGAKK